MTFENRPLVAELKVKMTQNQQFFMFSISALPQEGSFQMSIHIEHYSRWVCYILDPIQYIALSLPPPEMLSFQALVISLLAP